MSRPRRSLVIPVYREVARIDATLRDLAASDLAGPDTEIIVVDDGSDDDTVAVVRAALRAGGLPGRVVRRGRHLGKGSAVRGGVLASRGSTVVFTDADLSTPIPDIIACFEVLERNEADVVYASRAHEASRVDGRAPHHRVIAGRAFNRLLRALGLTDTLDTQCGLKGFRSEAARTLFADMRTNGFAFDVEILARAQRYGLRVEPLPVAWSHVEASRVRPVRDAISMTGDAVRIRLRLLGSSPVPTPPGGTTMTDEDVTAMADREQAHWWFVAKRRLVAEVLAELTPNSRVLDVGSGGGALVSDLRALGHRAWGTDLSAVSARLGRCRDPRTTGVVADAVALPVRPGSIDAITSLDVVEHLDDDIEALEGYFETLRPGGRLILTVPAYEWAWSGHDVVLGHRRRYDAPRLGSVLEAAGFVVDRVTYFHSWLVPPAALLRRTPLGRLVDDQEEASEGGPLSDRLFRSLTRAERALLDRTDLPFGLSLLALARRPG